MSSKTRHRSKCTECPGRHVPMSWEGETALPQRGCDRSARRQWPSTTPGRRMSQRPRQMRQLIGDERRSGSRLPFWILACRDFQIKLMIYVNLCVRRRRRKDVKGYAGSGGRKKGRERERERERERAIPSTNRVSPHRKIPKVRLRLAGARKVVDLL